jgi:hypothetical protein
MATLFSRKSRQMLEPSEDAFSPLNIRLGFHTNDPPAGTHSSWHLGADAESSSRLAKAWGRSRRTTRWSLAASCKIFDDGAAIGSAQRI